MCRKNKLLVLVAVAFVAAFCFFVTNHYRQNEIDKIMAKGLIDATGEMLKAMDRGDKATAGEIARLILSKPKWRSFIPANAVMGEISASEGDFAASERFYGVATSTTNRVGSMVYAGYANTLKELNKLTEAEVMARKAVEASNERYWQARVILASILVRKDAEKAKGSPEVMELISSALKYAPKGKRVKFKSEFFKPSDIKASILICGPSDTLYGAAGHAAIRVQSSECELDAVYSYEGEQISHNIIRFFLGRLKMGMFAFPTQDFIEEYRREGRGIWEYPLNLSPQAKSRLWNMLDERIAEGASLSYDYIYRGCAQTALKNILSAIDPEPITVGELPARLSKSRREIFHDHLGDAPWTRLMVHFITGANCEIARASSDRVLIPEDIVDYLLVTRVNGETVITSQSIDILPQTLKVKGLWSIISPMVVASFLLILAVIGCFTGKKWIHVAFLALYALLAVFETYLSFLSSLPCSAWNVLLIPFNPLPILFWHWCRFWRWPFAILVVGWSCWVLLASHIPTDPAFAILALAFVAQLLGYQGRILSTYPIDKKG